jgi:hypothetical protein
MLPKTSSTSFFQFFQKSKSASNFISTPINVHNEDDDDESKLYNNNNGNNDKQNDDSYRRIGIKSILKIQKGIQNEMFYTTTSTNIFNSNNNKKIKNKNIDAHCCLSIIALNRSLDIMLTTCIDRDRIYRAFICLLYNYKIDNVIFE